MHKDDPDTDDEAGSFSELVPGVRPLKRANKVSLPRKPGLDPERAASRKQRAEGLMQAGDDAYHADTFVSDEYVEMVKPDALIEYKRPGVQEGVYRKLRLGKYPLQARLDLHRKTVKEARHELFAFIRECGEHDLRCLLVLHGKGDRNVTRPAVLKSYTAKWLQEIPDVLAFHSAQPGHGGVGAVYVLLRKSERMKGLTREQHGGRR
ncbi:MAG: DNA endonuclease SmrA [Pseudomonadales bacterium]